MTHKDKEERAKYMRDYRAKKAKESQCPLAVRMSDKLGIANIRVIYDDAPELSGIYDLRSFLIDVIGYTAIGFEEYVGGAKTYRQLEDGTWINGEGEKLAPPTEIFYFEADQDL